jgi:hypothetical protein
MPEQNQSQQSHGAGPQGSQGSPDKGHEGSGKSDSQGGLAGEFDHQPGDAMKGENADAQKGNAPIKVPGEGKIPTGT